MANSAFSVTGISNAPASGLLKCWGYATVSGGTYTLQTSYNVQSITKTAVGQLAVAFSTPFTTSNYATSNGITSAGNEFWAVQVQPGTQTMNGFTIHMADATNQYADPASISWMCIGN